MEDKNNIISMSEFVGNGMLWSVGDMLEKAKIANMEEPASKAFVIFLNDEDGYYFPRWFNCKLKVSADHRTLGSCQDRLCGNFNLARIDKPTSLEMGHPNSASFLIAGEQRNVLMSVPLVIGHPRNPPRIIAKWTGRFIFHEYTPM